MEIWKAGLVKIITKNTAQKHISDIHGHSTEQGQPYFVDAYYGKSTETSKYQISKFANVYINPNERIPCNIDFDGQKIKNSNYISVCQDFY